MNGGKRPGAGRKKGSRGKAQQVAIDVAKQVLSEIDAVATWKALLTCGEPKVIADVMKYLTDRAHGKPPQSLAITGEGGGPITATLTILRAGHKKP